MTTYVDGKPIRYPRAGDWVRRYLHSKREERGLVTSVGMDGTVSVEWDEGDGELFQPDVLVLHRTGWYWIEPEEALPTEKSWG